jgi:hypothetical protein
VPRGQRNNFLTVVNFGFLDRDFNEGLHNLQAYFSQNYNCGHQTKENGWTGHVTRMREAISGFIR